MSDRVPSHAKAKKRAGAAGRMNWGVLAGASVALIVVLGVLLLMALIAGGVIYWQLKADPAVVPPGAGMPKFPPINDGAFPPFQPIPPVNEPMPPVVIEGEDGVERSIIKPPVDEDPAPKQPMPKEPAPKESTPKQPMAKEPAPRQQPMPKEPAPKEPAPKEPEEMATGHGHNGTARHALPGRNGCTAAVVCYDDGRSKCFFLMGGHSCVSYSWRPA